MMVQAALASVRNCLAAQPHGHLLAVVQEPGRVALRDAHRPRAEDIRLPTTLGDAYRAAACAWTPCGRFLLTAWQGGMGMLTMHKVDGVLQVQQLACEELFFWPKDVAVASKDERLLVALAGAPGVVLYCLEKSQAEAGPAGAWQLSQRARLCPMWPACAVSMSADGSTLAAAALGSQLHVWNLEPGLDATLLELQVQVPAERVTAVAFSPDGKHLAVITWAGSICLCSRSSRRQLLPELPAVLGKLDIQVAETCEERSKSRDSTALPTEVPPRSSASSARAGPDETTSRLAWIDHGTQGSGDWSFARSHLTDAPLKPQVACTSLLAWLDNGCLAASIQGCPVVFFRRCEERLCRLAGELTEGPSEELQEGGKLSAGKPGIRGLALLRSSQGNRLILSMHTCDGLGGLVYRQAEQI